MYKKLSNLNVGDIFQYGDTIYEIVEKGVWHAKCKYINETPKLELKFNNFKCPDGEIGRR